MVTLTARLPPYATSPPFLFRTDAYFFHVSFVSYFFWKWMWKDCFLLIAMMISPCAVPCDECFPQYIPSLPSIPHIFVHTIDIPISFMNSSLSSGLSDGCFILSSCPPPYRALIISGRVSMRVSRTREGVASGLVCWRCVFLGGKGVTR
ncbi:hypothetical protein AcV5_005118 [Taiwanofungus camphoratus]|nr:hypothetical protein AcV5_005118 [Antrodia cinnamomea]KAI0962363.1 hypothetical protein AcV7_001224 [Antrodia cinnamomea]